MKKCKYCNKEFQATRDWQSFCSHKCRNDFHAAERRVILQAGIDALKFAQDRDKENQDVSEEVGHTRNGVRP